MEQMNPINNTPFDRRAETDRPSDTMAGEGKLVFQVTTAGGAIPLSGAEITVRAFRSLSDDDRGEVLAVLHSGNDGKSEMLTLPAPAKTLSLEPAKDGNPTPYALYDADVYLDQFYRQSYIRIPVFDGITSIQRVSLIPLPENGYSDGLHPDSERFVEGESPNL